ncbi:MAG TPA: PadR family transcriptional regulator [Thermoplasmata archaeon]|nr:PadR family transcriptional regulator [Thermoplasmata archaeon]
MAAKRQPTPPWQRGFLGTYALTVLDRAPMYAHQLSTQISSRSRGLWSPSPGAIYPAFRSLEARGLIRAQRHGARRIYRITAAGRRRLSEVRAARAQWAERFGGSWRLMLDMVEPERRVESALRRVRQALAMGEALVEGEEEALTGAERAYLRRTILVELERATKRIRSAHAPRRVAPGERAR